MKNKKICPKCNSNNIIIIPANKSANIIYYGKTAFSKIYVSIYICENCGFFENYIKKKEDIIKMKKKYK